MAEIIKGVSNGQISIGNSPVGHCPEHGFFDLPGVVIEGVELDFSGIYTNCPTCGRIMKFVPGLYVPKESGYDILLGPDTPSEVLNALIDIAKRMERAEISIEQASRELAGLSPALDRYFNPTHWSDGVKGAVVGALLTYALSLANAPQSSTTVNNYFQTTVVSVETSEKQTPDFSVPIPRPRPLKPSR